MFSDKGLVLRATWCATCHVQRGILDFIHQARSSEQHHILVNCVQGISRSAAVVSQRQTSQQKQAIRNSCFKAGSMANLESGNLNNKKLAQKPDQLGGPSELHRGSSISLLCPKVLAYLMKFVPGPAKTNDIK